MLLVVVTGESCIALFHFNVGLLFDGSGGRDSMESRPTDAKKMENLKPMLGIPNSEF